MKCLCVHAHFYQPPRENPWLEQIELQDSAYPYHDWNERIEAECYAPNLAARILDDAKYIKRILNNYSKISFDFGPTLLSWLAEHTPDVYKGIIDADRQSQKQFSGHGSGMAQAYNHMILPLANSRDKKTQIVWGFEDFVKRFGRVPEGMWLPETAADLESLDLMAQAGLSFAVLAPRQAKATRPLAGGDWQTVTGAGIDPSRPYLLKTGENRSIALFFYDGPISQAVAFQNLLTDGETFAKRLLSGFSDARNATQLMHIATDGETYGHHHRYGEMALAYAVDYIESKKLAKLTNYGEFLERNPPSEEVQIHENTSWSCAHGIERWRSNCGCSSGKAGWNQEWRKPLRTALDWLRDTVNPRFEELGATLLRDPWLARDSYIHVVLNRSPEIRKHFGEQHFARDLCAQDQVTVWKLLELQRHAMLMYTSCGWFFDELSGIETVQIIEYAGRVVQLAQEIFGDGTEAGFLDQLSAAKSNLPEVGTGADVYRMRVKPSIVDLEKVGAHYAISSLFAPYAEGTDIFAYKVKRLDYHTTEAGQLRTAVGQARFTSKVTQESEDLSFWVVHFGDHNVAGGVQACESFNCYQEIVNHLADSLSRVDLPEIVRLLDKTFGANLYSLRSLFRDEQRRIVRTIVSTAVSEAEAAYLQLYKDHAPLMRFVANLGTPMPREFAGAMEYAVNSLLRRACVSDELNAERIQSLLREAQASKVKLDETTLEYNLRRRVEHLSARFSADPLNVEKLADLASALKITKLMPFPVTLWSAQNHAYALQSGLYQRTRRKAQRGDAKAEAWVKSYEALCELLKLRVG